MNKYETFACNQIFHSYPQDLTYKELKLLCEDEEALEKFNDELEDEHRDDEQLILCEEYEHISWNSVPKILDNFVRSAESHFKDN